MGYIKLEFYSNFYIREKIAIQAAVMFWNDIVEGSQEVNPNGLEIHFGQRRIDGRGGILAYASPFSGVLPVFGFITFDSDDLEHISDSALLNTAKHEIGHILGIGSLWKTRKLIQGENTDNPLYTGKKAAEEYQKLLQFPEKFVPVENKGGPGTRNLHWREDLFKNELMTGYSDEKEVLSRVTVASLEDLGYRVSYDYCDDFSL